MEHRLHLVSDRSADHGAGNGSRRRSGGAPAPVHERTGYLPEFAFRVPASRTRRRALRGLLLDERGAVTAEYAIVILAAVAFAGVLVAIMRSSEIREMLVGLVENALGTGA